MTRRLALAVAALTMAAAPQTADASVGGIDTSDTTIDVWVVGQTNGGISRPAGTSNCSPWTLFDTTTPGVLDGQIVERPDARLFVRSCDGINQYAWVANLSPRQLAQVAFDQARATIPDPTPTFAPPPEAMLVNLDTWFAVEPTGPISATASIPGLSVTVTAVPIEIILNTGSQVDGDITAVSCRPWGSTRYGADGCTWTPSHPSVEQVTGTDDYRYHASVELIWQIDWRASNGTTGDLGTISSTTDVLIAVREIQTIGVPNP
jgi:hypothetical protein